jgi:methylmalonyl-CoA carboxyltransferase 5S subunit
LILNTEYQLKGQGAPHLLQEVVAEIQNVRRDAGYPALAIPASEVLGTQAMFNVLQGRYKVITSEFADLVLGYYGTTLGGRNAEVTAKAEARANKPAINCRPADLLQPSWEQRRADALAVPGCNGTDEDALTYAMFPKTAAEFFANRKTGPKDISKKATATQAKAAAGPPDNTSEDVRSVASQTYVVRINGQEHKVTVTPAQG